MRWAGSGCEPAEVLLCDSLSRPSVHWAVLQNHLCVVFKRLLTNAF